MSDCMAAASQKYLSDCGGDEDFGTHYNPHEPPFLRNCLPRGVIQISATDSENTLQAGELHDCTFFPYGLSSATMQQHVFYR